MNDWIVTLAWVAVASVPTFAALMTGGMVWFICSALACGAVALVSMDVGTSREHPGMLLVGVLATVVAAGSVQGFINAESAQAAELPCEQVTVCVSPASYCDEGGVE